MVNVIQWFPPIRRYSSMGQTRKVFIISSIRISFKLILRLSFWGIIMDCISKLWLASVYLSYKLKNKITFLAWNIHFRFLKCLLFTLFYFENWKYQKILILPNIWCTQISIWKIDIIWHLFWRYEFYHQAFLFSIAVPTILSISWNSITNTFLSQ